MFPTAYDAFSLNKLDHFYNIPENMDELFVQYPGLLVVDPGMEITPTEAKDEPLLFWQSDSDSLYTLIMTEPDWHDRCKDNEELIHWLVVNIPEAKIVDGLTITPYIGAFPLQKRGMQRFVFLLYKQEARIEDTDLERSKSHFTKNRHAFESEKFVKKFNLQGPVAGNLFQAKYDKYTDTFLDELIEMELKDVGLQD